MEAISMRSWTDSPKPDELDPQYSGYTHAELGQRNVFIYWTGPDFTLIRILRELMVLHARSGRGYQLVLITPETVPQYFPAQVWDKIKGVFSDLSPNHQSDVLRVYAVLKYGGIYLDSDTLVMEALDSLFDVFWAAADSERRGLRDGWFLKMPEVINKYGVPEYTTELIPGSFGSRSDTPILRRWASCIERKLEQKLEGREEEFEWTELVDFLNDMWRSEEASERSLFDNYEIFSGLDGLYPVEWMYLPKALLDDPFDNWREIECDFQPFITLLSTVYRSIEERGLTEDELWNGDRFPLSYFLRKSRRNGREQIGD